MRRLINAFKAFFKALGAPQEAQRFLLEEAPEKPKTESGDRAHLRLLTILQQSGRLVDFLQEDITSYSDAQVGAAVRQLHEGCRKSLEEMVTIRPVFEEQEGSQVSIPAGYDPARIKIVGSVKGEPPFQGELVHSGWQVKRQSLPKSVGRHDSDVIQPAEVEVH